jgi:hypothetical protein
MIRDVLRYCVPLLALLVHEAALAQTRTVTGAPACDSCRIQLDRTVRIGERSDSVGIAGLPRVALGARGNFYVISDLLPTAGALVYDSAGRHQGTLGREGSGPGELRQAVRIATNSPGQVFLQDPYGTVHVFGPDGHFMQSLPGIAPALTNMAVIGDSMLALPTRSRPRTAPDRPVQLYGTRSGRWLLGIGPREDLVGSTPPTIASVAASASGAVWIVRVPDEIQLWSLNGSRLATLSWSRDWLRFAGVARLPPENAYVLHDVWEDPANGLLWVVSVFDDPDAANDPPPGRAGQPIPRGALDPSRLNAAKNSVVSVLDPRSGRIVAHLRLDEAIYEFLRDGRIVTMRENADGHQELVILSLRLIGYD